MLATCCSPVNLLSSLLTKLKLQTRTAAAPNRAEFRVEMSWRKEAEAPSCDRLHCDCTLREHFCIAIWRWTSASYAIKYMLPNYLRISEKIVTTQDFINRTHIHETLCSLEVSLF